MLLLLVEFWFDENAEKQGAAGSVNWGPVGHCFSFICVLPARKKNQSRKPRDTAPKSQWPISDAFGVGRGLLMCW